MTSSHSSMVMRTPRSLNQLRGVFVVPRKDSAKLVDERNKSLYYSLLFLQPEIKTQKKGERTWQ